MKIKKIGIYSMLVITSLTLTFSSCKKEGCTDPLAKNYDDKAKKDDGTCEYDSVETIEPYVVMTTYMKDNSLDLPGIITNWTISAHDLDSLGTTNYYIIDIRDAADYNTGHIPGAINTTLANIKTQAASAGGKPIVVVCYTGQSAGHGHVALRLSGYSDCKILLFGMSSWNGDFDKWTTNTGDAAIGNSNWTTTNSTLSPVAFTEPTFTSTLTDGSAILSERVDYMLTNGFQGINGTDVLAAPTNYFINNYWAATDVDTYGNISGSYRIKEDLSLASNGFKYLNKDQTVVTYCWTGQTSSVITAYLTVLGYNAKSLKFGVNSLIYSNLTGHKWGGSGSYAYE